MDAHDRPNRIPWPPILLLATIAAAIGLNWLFPLAWFGGLSGQVTGALGIVVIVIAFAIHIWATIVFRRHQTTMMPHRRSARLVTSGPFRFSRNPIYVGNLMLVAGLGLALGNLWFLILTPILGYALLELAIRGEERHLEALFGDAWRDYKARVRRWV